MQHSMIVISYSFQHLGQRLTNSSIEILLIMTSQLFCLLYMLHVNAFYITVVGWVLFACALKFGVEGVFTP